MAYTQAQWVADFRDHLGDTGSNGWSDYQLITATRRAYESAWPDFWLPYLDTTTYTRYASVAANTNIIPVPSTFINRDIFNIYARTNVYQQGTAIYSLSGSPVFTTSAAPGFSANQQVQVDGSSLPGGLSSGTAYYIRPVTSTNTTFTTTNGSTTFTTPGAHGYTVNEAVVLTGSVSTGFTSGSTYYLVSAPTTTTFTVASTIGGTAITAQSAGSGTVTLSTAQNFNLSLTSGGPTISATSTASGYVGALFTDNSYKDFTKLELGLMIDPLKLAAPNIRFNRILGNPYELWIEGSTTLAYPTLTVTTVASNATMSFTSTDPAFTAVVGDKVYFYATAPGGFTAGTPYYIVTASSTTFQLSATSGGGAITPTTSRTFTCFGDNATLPGTDFDWFPNFLRYQGEVNVTRERQRSGNLDRRAMAQRRLLAAQDVTEARSHRMRPQQRTTFRWIG